MLPCLAHNDNVFIKLTTKTDQIQCRKVLCCLCMHISSGNGIVLNTQVLTFIHVFLLFCCYVYLHDTFHSKLSQPCQVGRRMTTSQRRQEIENRQGEVNDYIGMDGVLIEYSICRSRDRDSDRRRRRDDDDNDRRRHRDRSRDRDRDRDRDRRRDRDRDRDRRHRSRSRSRDRDRDRGRDRDKDNEREKSAAAPAIPAAPSLDELEEKAQREARRRQKEIDDLTKDQRTVFVSQLTAKVTDKDIKDFFSQLGAVNNVILIRDKYTGRHKGFCYVEMADLESVPNCLLLNGLPPDFQKFPILVKASEAEKNFLARKDVAPSAPGTHASGGGGRRDERDMLDSRVYVGNLHVNINEEDLEQVLSQFGRVESVHIHRDELGTSKGYAFGKFARGEDAARAITKLSGLELAGRSIKVGYVTDGGGTSGGGGSDRSSAYASGNWKLDDDEGSGMQMNAQSRAMLMAKLGQGAGMQMPNMPASAAALMKPAPAPTQAAGSNAPTKAPPVGGEPSPCFYIKNMFVLEEEVGDDWDKEIAEDVTEECRKFGAVSHCHVEKHKPGGFVYLKFASVQAATQAAQSLNGRWFAGKMITCTFMHPAEYASKFRV